MNVNFRSKSLIIAALVKCENWGLIEEIYKFADKYQDSGAELTKRNGLRYVEGFDTPVPRGAYF